ncbi:HNH endonuclease signature motif containing protein [Bacillus cytotoxicus]|nr:MULTISPECIES: HNH endonuclease signature motif containing protein [Bacillus cereus group]EMA6344869.1 HNH endonuclease [Bacillus cytotoxicus]QTR81221.1 HNH endonuclease [Bacillus cytotoxicus]QTR83168.1 HNH endonuclease [Bacillus cytotoxicus]QTR86905.1 HNH endonuclease [Bacillus cytotoxicus]
MDTYEELCQSFRNLSQAYWKETGRSKICERCCSTVDVHLHHKKALQLGGTNAYDNLVPLCGECHREYHRHFEGVKTFEYFMNTPKHTELIGIWEMLNSQTVDFLLGKEVKDLINKGLWIKRDLQKSSFEEKTESK